KQCNIPIFHDDQHGTAIIATAGILNGTELVGKKLENLKVVVNGAGAAGISCVKMLLTCGVKPERVIMCDSKGVIYAGRKEGMTPEKKQMAVETDARTLAEAMVDADVFLGLSVADCVSPEMLSSMARDPIVFAMSNPDPEITYDLAIATRDDVIMATGRSDYPNQINNVLGFPFIFRGALDVRSVTISEGMKLAAAKALADLAKEPVPETVKRAYGGQDFSFGRTHHRLGCLSDGLEKAYGEILGLTIPASSYSPPYTAVRIRSDSFLFFHGGMGYSVSVEQAMNYTSSGIQVLLVDDERISREVEAHLLTSGGCRVVTAAL
ncbi:MAG: hypothetical protein J7D61_17415, partial [Marichromatium sp.]|nr:hypothetical protein [Marichromatium sp.]